ncbi:phenylalanine--tRNA ligase subunit alpha [Candidatus Micrarchaeota archaeon]|nr:phenylalanine--tRNA ligase subunit alpha [Candidatus Micrarchaeota archaeon]
MYKGEEIVLDLISKKKQLTLAAIIETTKFNEDTLRRIVESLKTAGYVKTTVSEKHKGKPTQELLNYCTSEFPEFSVFKKAVSGASISALSPVEKSIGIRWAKIKGFVDIENGKLVPRKKQEEINPLLDSLRLACNQLKQSGTTENLVIMEELFERRLLQKITERTVSVSYTGKEVPLEAGFDINVPAANAPLGKNHPITKITKKIKSIMSELGFQEMDGSIIESSFWNFDALFQPQDHPARELADTFYLDENMPLPEDAQLVKRVKAAHEHGWKYKWDPREASKAVLRTHTTALSARYLAAMKDKKPRKYFAIGRVFRNEATDYKHLAEFHQVEGIIAWEDASFTDLLGILKEFYRKLGFEKIRFRPSYFPYTEPSLEVEVYFEEKKQWLELGGAGIFRPEVSIPLAGVYPVLAWGLSLERPLMLLLELDDIRTFYKNDLDFLISSRLDL